MSTHYLKQRQAATTTSHTQGQAPPLTKGDKCPHDKCPPHQTTTCGHHHLSQIATSAPSHKQQWVATTSNNDMRPPPLTNGHKRPLSQTVTSTPPLPVPPHSLSHCPSTLLVPSPLSLSPSLFPVPPYSCPSSFPVFPHSLSLCLSFLSVHSLYLPPPL